ncbi:putative bifunctional diguanylate cyclase/phosphodiesterase [Quadrisphaera sp. KR29]|uniref:putative bifunctional diguanylate cyclase/phosphodiesterase n=1 Tax=Quadrisphaera sp. KR29 TaxID=3461391 RepID=UPI0040447B31
MTSPDHGRWRAAATAGPTLGALAVWSAGLAVTAGAPAAQHFSNGALMAVAVAAGAAALLRARREHGHVRRFWLLLGFGVLSWGAGQAVWTWYESVLGLEVPFPSAADVGYLGFPVLAAAGLAAVLLRRRSRAGRLRDLVDGLLVATALLVVSWLLVLRPIVSSGDRPLLTVISLAYPVADIVVMTALVHALARARQLRESLPVPLGVVGAGLAAFAISDVSFVYLTNTGLYSSGSPTDSGWFVGFALLLLAARLDAPAIVREGVESHRILSNALPYTAVVVALVTSVTEVVLRDHSSDLVTFWLRSLMIVLLVARQVLTLVEVHSLTGGLERRVAARTQEVVASQQRFASLVAHSSDLVTVVDAAGLITYQSPSSARVLGREAGELVGHPLTDVLDGRRDQSLRELLSVLADDGLRSRHLRSAWRHASGRRLLLDVTVTNLLADPHVQGFVLNGRDVTDRVRLEEELTQQAFTDALTGLPNRALFKDRLEQALRRRTTEDELVVVCYFDLDGFKAVNDTLGHSAGDELLAQVADRVRDVVREGDTVARLGGDEFAVLVQQGPGSGPAEVEADGRRLASRVCEAIRRPFQLRGGEVHVAASAGLATSATTGRDAEQLLRSADLAMYQAKAEGAGGYAVYHPSMHEQLVDRVRLEADLRRAVAEEQFRVVYQPLIDMGSGRVTGVEALVRWAHPERGTVSPLDFIPLAESTGLIIPIGAYVLREACRQTAHWRSGTVGCEDMRVSVNLSGHQVRLPGLADDVAEVLAATGLPATALVLEMTESVLIDKAEETLATLHSLRAMGIRLAIDDFGTGYSSLSYLHRLPVDILKIDKSFVDRMTTGGDTSLVDTILGLAGHLQLTTVAEGIEHEHQRAALAAQGCDTGQGYHFSPPVPADVFPELVAGALRPLVPAEDVMSVE